MGKNLMTYAVRLEQFEGPLELLLQLIEKEKLDVTRVSLARVADQYLEYLQSESHIPLAHLAQFLSVAARLVLLKSRALLPLLEFTDEEEEAIVDLEWQLREYRRYRDASLHLGKLFAQHTGACVRERSLNFTEGIFFPPESLEAHDLKGAFIAVLGEIPIMEELEEKELKAVVKLEEKMAHFREHLAERVETSFQAMTKSVEDRVELIVSFLALLQLVKERWITVEQSEFFGEIAVRHNQKTE